MLECPVCYGLIENSVLAVRQEIFIVQQRIKEIISSISMIQIIPFFQAITSMQESIKNITVKANSWKVTVSGLDLLWQTLDDKINIFLNTLQSSTMAKITILLHEANAIFTIHNLTVYQFSDIHRFLILSHSLVQNTVNARMQQQVVALNELNKLASEMTRYVSKATTRSNSVLTKKYDLMQKIRISINAAKQAADSALIIRNRAIALTSTIGPVHDRAVIVQIYAVKCIKSIDAWQINATSTLGYAQKVLTDIKIAIPNHSAVFAYLLL